MEYANSTWSKINQELPQQLKNQNNIRVIFVGGLDLVDDKWGFGFPIFGWACGGYAVIASQSNAFNTQGRRFKGVLRHSRALFLVINRINCYDVQKSSHGEFLP